MTSLDTSPAPPVSFNAVFDIADLRNLIVLYVRAPVDLIQLSRTCKKHHACGETRRAILHVFRANIGRIVQRCGYSELARRNDPEGGYTSLLQPSQCMISGSVVLQALTGEDWISSDIDMYVTSDAYDERVREKMISEMGYISMALPYTTDEDAYDQREFVGTAMASGLSTILDAVETWESLEPKAMAVEAERDRIYSESWNAGPTGMLQVIKLKPHVATAEEGTSTFDMDIVKNTWDGTTLHVSAFDAVVTRTAQCTTSVCDMLTAFGDVDDPTAVKVSRLLALLNRGDKVPVQHLFRRGDSKTGIKKVFSAIFRRLIKYSRRGYRIIAASGKELKAATLARVITWIEDENDTKSVASAHCSDDCHFDQRSERDSEEDSEWGSFMDRYADDEDDLDDLYVRTKGRYGQPSAQREKHRHAHTQAVPGFNHHTA